jgi:hypothetical protein
MLGRRHDRRLCHRMNRNEFFARLAPLDPEQRGKVLWNLY